MLKTGVLVFLWKLIHLFPIFLDEQHLFEKKKSFIPLFVFSDQFWILAKYDLIISWRKKNLTEWQCKKKL